MHYPPHFRLMAAGTLAMAALGVSLNAQDAPALFFTLSTAQIAADAPPTQADTLTIAPPGGGWTYAAAAPVAGETFNVIKRPNPGVGSNSLSTKGTYPLNSATDLALVDATGGATTATLSVRLNIQDLDGNTTRTEPNTGSGGNSVLAPTGLMNEAWRIYRGGNSTEFEIDGLPANAHYYVYFYGSTQTDGQGCKYTIPAANSPTSADMAAETAGGLGGNIFADNSGTITLLETGTTWIRVHAKTDATGQFMFLTSKNAKNGQYFNGFQMMPYPKVNIDLQPPPTPIATTGNSVSIPISVSGDGEITFQWLKNGSVIPDNASALTDTLVLTNVQAGDAATYTVKITNPGGTVESQGAVLSVTNDAVAPTVTADPQPILAVTGQNVTFESTTNGTSPLTYEWSHSFDNVIFTPVPDSNSPALTISNVTVEKAGYYRVHVTNSVGDATSQTATLTVAPVITDAPEAAILTLGSLHDIVAVATAGQGAPVATTYVWKRDGVILTDDGSVQGTATSTATILSASASVSGYYTVTASNPAGNVTSAPVYVGVPTSQSYAFAPQNQTVGLSIDQQLRIVFPEPPKIGKTGLVTVHDAENGAIVETIDVSKFKTFSLFSAIIPNADVRTVQGASYYYMPVAIYGNEVWITLKNRLAYGKSYYLNIQPGTILDSTNAAFPGITDSTTWRISTKATGLETPTASTGPTTLIVAQDGQGDFATLQGAFDWVPQNNTLPRTIYVRPGIYRDNATLAQNRHQVRIIGTGESRDDVQLYYPYAGFSTANDRGAGTLRIESDDVIVQNLTIDNGVYLFQPSNNAPAFAGPINTVATTGKRLVFENILMKGGQDTLYTIRGIAHFENCEIWGSVDFVYGEALGVFYHCDIVQIRPVGGPVGAPNTPLAQPYGEVFLECRFPRALVANGYPYDVNVGSTTFMRPWRQDGATAIINCQVDVHFSAKGWGEWSADEGSKEVTCRAREYGTTLMDGTPVTPAERQAAGAYWLNTIDPDYTGGTMLPSNPLLAPATGTGNRIPVTVDPADYTLDAIYGHPYFGLNGWRPAFPPRVSTLPMDQQLAKGASLRLSPTVVGSAPLTYAWYRNGSPVGSDATYAVPSAKASHQGNYTVVITNAVGTTTSEVIHVQVAAAIIPWAGGYGLDATAEGFAESDTDGDGVANALEFLLGTSPIVRDSAQIAATFTTANGETAYRYVRAASASADTAEIIEISTDCQNWTVVTPGSGGVTQQVEALDDGYERVTLTLSGQSAPLFARVRLQL